MKPTVYPLRCPSGVCVVGAVTPALASVVGPAARELAAELGATVLLVTLAGVDAAALRAATGAGAVGGGDAAVGAQVHVLELPDWCPADDWPKVLYRLALEAGATTVVDWRVPLPSGVVAAALAQFEGAAAGLALLPAAVPGAEPANRLLRRLSGVDAGDFPVRLRLLRSDFLGAVPFEINSACPLFDLELLCQAAYLQLPVLQLDAAAAAVGAGAAPCAPPTRWEALRCLLQFEAHRRGMACSLRYRNLAPIRYQDKTAMSYTSHTMALAEIAARRPERVLDIGCGPGFIAERCRGLGCRVTGLDVFEPLPGKVDEFKTCNIDQEPLPVDPFAYDAMLMLDVIEHLSEPESFLLGLRNDAQPLPAGRQPPVFVLTTPNVAFAGVRLNLLLGRFNYAERGILDITHTRLMTRSSLLGLLRDCGYDILDVKPVPVPFEAVMRGGAGRFLGRVAAALAWLWPTMFAFQFLVVSRPKPGVRQVLQRMAESKGAAVVPGQAAPPEAAP